MPGITFSTVIKLLLASLVVGMVMAYFQIEPRDLVRWAAGSIDDVLANAQAWIGWAIKYVLLGAVVVVPIWLLGYLFRFIKR